MDHKEHRDLQTKNLALPTSYTVGTLQAEDGRSELAASFLTITLYSSIYCFMKTTIDIPDEILYRAKVLSAKRKTTLKALVLHGLLMELECADNVSAEPDPFIEALSTGHNTKPVGRLNREQIHDRKIFH